MQNIPYNTGKVLIGSMYQKPSPVPTPEELWIQSALLGDAQYDENLVWSCICGLVVAVIVVAMNVYTP